MTLSDDHESPPLPCAEALVAGTVALMTTWADPSPHGLLDTAAQRALLARKIVSNLFFLEHHPALSDGLRSVMHKAHQRWAAMAHPQASQQEISPNTTAAAAPPRATMALH